MYINKCSLLVTSVLFAWSFSGFALANRTLAQQDIVTLTPFKGQSVWIIQDGWRFVISHGCSDVPYLYGFWPDDAQCKGYLSAELHQPETNNYYERRLRELNGPVIGDDVSVGGQWGDASELYQHMTRIKDPVVKFGDLSYRLGGFQERVAQNRQESYAVAQAQIESERSEIWKIAIAVVLGCVFAAVGLWFAYRTARRIVPLLGSRVKELAGISANKAKDSLNDLRDIHTRHIVRDEAIRAATRSSLDTTREERALLRNQIERALNEGNVELAKTLTVLLRKLEGDHTKA